MELELYFSTNRGLFFKALSSVSLKLAVNTDSVISQTHTDGQADTPVCPTVVLQNASVCNTWNSDVKIHTQLEGYAGTDELTDIHRQADSKTDEEVIGPV